MNIDFQEILKELEYRVPNGIINLNEDSQVTTLVDILRENGVDDANHLAQKARGYFGFINEAAPKKDSIEKILSKTIKNPDTGNDVKVASALGYDKKSQAYRLAAAELQKGGYSKKDIDMVDAGPDDEEKPVKGTDVFGKGKGVNVFDKPTPQTVDDENVEGKYDTNDRLQKNIVEAKNDQQLFKALDEMGKDEASLMYDKVQAGAGGPVASTGETMCCESQTNMIQGRYNPKKVRFTPEFNKNLKDIDAILQSTDKRKKAAIEKELTNICDKMGLYDKKGTPNYNEAKLIFAEASTYIQNTDKEFSKTKVAREKFKKEEDRISWLKASFYSSYSLMNNGPEDWDRKQGNGRVIKANSRTDGATKKLLDDGFKNAKTPKEKAHYEKQLKSWEKFKGYHDTYLVYVNKDGHKSVYHISNKKGDDLSDPQNNTTPEKRIANYKEAAKEAKLNPKAVKIVDDAQNTALAGSSDNDNIAKSAYSKIDKNSIKLVASLSNRLPARGETDVKDEYIADLRKDKLIKAKLGSNWEKANPEEVVKAAMDIVMDKNTNVSKLSGNFTKFILKQGQLAQSIYSKAQSGLSTKQIVDKYKGIYSEKEIAAILQDPTMKMLSDRKAQHAAGLEGVHKGFIDSLHQADGTKIGDNKPNGPAVETYVRGTLKSLHIDTYCANYDNQVQIEMGGVGCTPIDVRGCMANLSGFKGDTKSEKGRADLINHLSKNVKVDSDSDAVYLVGDNGQRTYIASDTWRQAGSAKKIATAFGSNLRSCLKKSVGNRLANKK